MPAGSPFPGPWRTDRTPYLRAPMRAFADPAVDVVVLLLRRQRGKTEFAANCLGWMWDTCTAPALWINPTEKLARSFASDRVKKMFRTVPGLLDRTLETREGSLEKFVDGVRFGIGWAGSSTEVSSHPCKFAVIDERSRMASDASGEGDPVRIVQEGGGFYPGSTTIVISSPTEELICPTFDWWAQGTRMRYCWRCPECGEWFVPCRATARYPKDAPYHVIREEACIVCPGCDHDIGDDTKESVEAEYQPSTIDDAGNITLTPGIATRNSIASFWATGLSDQITHIGEAMEKYARAARTGKVEDTQAVVNTTFGELFAVPVERIHADAVKDRQIAQIPGKDLAMVTVGVDVQKDRVYYAVRGWAPLVTSYGLGYGVELGDPQYDDVWIRLASKLDTTFCGLRPLMVLVDSGYQTAMVYQQCRLRLGWEPSKGNQVGPKPHWDTLVDESMTGRQLKTLRLWHHSVDVWQQWLNARIRRPFGEPGAWYVQSGVDDTYCAQVTNQGCVTRKGKRQWQPLGTVGDHWRDCEILCAVAADIQQIRSVPVPRPVGEKVEKPKESELLRRQREINERSTMQRDPFARQGL